jgi:hypothetical protein
MGRFPASSAARPNRTRARPARTRAPLSHSAYSLRPAQQTRLAHSRPSPLPLPSGARPWHRGGRRRRVPSEAEPHQQLHSSPANTTTPSNEYNKAQRGLTAAMATTVATRLMAWRRNSPFRHSSD